MKTLPRALPLLILALAIAGCSTTPAAKGTAPIVQPLLDKLLPSDFRGPAHLEDRGMYVTVVLDAGDVHRRRDGVWTWSWLTYQQIVTFPLAPGMHYANTGIIRLGTPTPPADGIDPK